MDHVGGEYLLYRWSFSDDRRNLEAMVGCAAADAIEHGRRGERLRAQNVVSIGEYESTLRGLPGCRPALSSRATAGGMHLQHDATVNTHQQPAARTTQSATYQTVRSAAAGRWGAFQWRRRDKWRGEERREGKKGCRNTAHCGSIIYVAWETLYVCSGHK